MVEEGLNAATLLGTRLNNAIELTGDMLIPGSRVVMSLDLLPRHAMTKQEAGEPTDQHQGGQGQEDLGVAQHFHNAHTSCAMVFSTPVSNG